MDIQIKSDIHLDDSHPKFRNRSLSSDLSLDLVTSPKAEALILAGDIVEDNPYKYFDDFGHLTIPVIYVPGNHEYRNGDVDKTPAKLKHMFRDTNVHMLNRDYVLINDVMFIGATLWTRLGYPYTYANTDGMIPFHNCAGTDDLWWSKSFYQDFMFIKSCLEDPLFKDYKKVVVTHFLPSINSVGARFKDHPLNEYFVSESPMEIMHGSHAPLIWVHGHTHDSFDYREGNTRIICNPYGGFGRDLNPKFNPELVVRI